jgi:hypothetical protein
MALVWKVLSLAVHIVEALKDAEKQWGHTLSPVEVFALKEQL